MALRAASDVDSGAALSRITSSLVRALSFQKLAFFLLALALAALIVGMFAGLARLVSEVSVVAAGPILFLAVLAAIGLGGVIEGGVAHLTNMEGEGRATGVADAFRACARRFPALFGGTLLLLLAIGVILAVVNGFVWGVNKLPGVGPIIAALLFLPQVAVNVCLGLALLVSTLL